MKTTWADLQAELGRMGGQPRHVFGVRYDHDDEAAAHPVHHSQMRSMTGYVEHIDAAYRANYAPVEPDMDAVKGVLTDVRILCARMDVFSAFLQVAGDHLAGTTSAQRVKDTFGRLRVALTRFDSAPAAAPGLDAATEQRRFRSGHWYRYALGRSPSSDKRVGQRIAGVASPGRVAG